MNLTILCITNGRPHAAAYIQRMYEMSRRIGAEFILGLDGGAAQNAGCPCDRWVNVKTDKLQEDVADSIINDLPDCWLLRLDDDEVVSPALEKWLMERGYEKAAWRLYAFPRVYMWGDERHIITNDGIWPDLQTRLGWRPLMLGYNHVHAGNPNGTGVVVPYALEHHSLLVKTREEREAISARYEACRPGAGTRPEYAIYLLPERFFDPIKVKEYTDGDYGR